MAVVEEYDQSGTTADPAGTERVRIKARVERLKKIAIVGAVLGFASL